MQLKRAVTLNNNYNLNIEALVASRPFTITYYEKEKTKYFAQMNALLCIMKIEITFLFHTQIIEKTLKFHNVHTVHIY